MIQMISYDLHRPAQNYEGVIKEIKSLGPWCHALASTWLVQTNMTSSQVYEALKAQLDANDLILINSMGVQRSGFLQDEVAAWLRTHS